MTMDKRNSSHLVRVVHGANEGQFQLEGCTVGQVARSLREVFNIPGNASALVNGNEVSGSHQLTSGDNVEFVRTFGLKGGLHDFWSEEEVRELFGDDAIETLRCKGCEPVPKLVFTRQQIADLPHISVEESSDATDTTRIFSVDFSSMTLTYGDQGPFEIDGTLKFKLLQRLAVRPGYYIALNTLKLDVWKDPDLGVEDETVDRTARRLRATLQAFGLSGVGLKKQANSWALILK
jgi:hypothetical protein